MAAEPMFLPHQRQLRLLLVEDKPSDAALVVLQLRKGRYTLNHKRVWTIPALEAAITSGDWDFVITDHALAGFNAFDVLRTMRQLKSDIPVIVVSGTIGEDMAVKAMMAGARDYVMKDNLLRLVPAIERELEEVEAARLRRFENRRVETERRNQETMFEEEHRRAELARLENEAKSRFLANMSHELRNPLNSVLGFAQLLGTQDPGNLSDKQARYVTHIESAGRHLLGIVNDILDLSKVAAGELKIDLERVPVDTVIEACLIQMEGLADERRVRLLTAGTSGLSVIADRLRLQQILINLVSNAIKFTPPEGSVTMRRGYANQSVQVTVSDTGIGIPADKQAFVFDEFTQVESDHAEGLGTGLGLSLSRRLAELLGGSIKLTSELGRGSDFTLNLVPASSEGRNGRHPAPRLRGTPRRPQRRD